VLVQYSRAHIFILTSLVLYYMIRYLIIFILWKLCLSRPLFYKLLSPQAPRFLVRDHAYSLIECSWIAPLKIAVHFHVFKLSLYTRASTSIGVLIRPRYVSLQWRLCASCIRLPVSILLVACLYRIARVAPGPFQDFLSDRMAKQAAGVMKDRGWDDSKALLVIASDVGEVGAR